MFVCLLFLHQEIKHQVDEFGAIEAMTLRGRILPGMSGVGTKQHSSGFQLTQSAVASQVLGPPRVSLLGVEDFFQAGAPLGDLSPHCCNAEQKSF